MGDTGSSFNAAASSFSCRRCLFANTSEIEEDIFLDPSSPKHIGYIID